MLDSEGEWEAGGEWDGDWEVWRRVVELRGLEEDAVVVRSEGLLFVDGPAFGDARGRGGLNGKRRRFAGGWVSGISV